MNHIQYLLDIFGYGEFLPNNKLFDWLGDKVCPFNVDVEDICEDALFIVCGYDRDNLNLVSLLVHMYFEALSKSVILLWPPVGINPPSTSTVIVTAIVPTIILFSTLLKAPFIDSSPSVYFTHSGWNISEEL